MLGCCKAYHVSPDARPSSEVNLVALGANETLVKVSSGAKSEAVKAEYKSMPVVCPVGIGASGTR